MKQIIAVVMLSVIFGNVFGQHLESSTRTAIDQRNFVAEPAARLARCGRMDFALHLIDVYVDHFSGHLAISPYLLRERLLKMSYEQYEVLQLVNWPAPQTATVECAAQIQFALELIARWSLE